MSGKRLLDLAALFNASRGVAQKHIALRTRQVETYNRTSSLAHAIRNQTERVTETVKAASFLAARLNESAPTWTSENGEEKLGGGPIPSRESTTGRRNAPQREGGLEQDHFYERSIDNSAVDELPSEDLQIKQDTTSRYTLPDGTIPPENSPLNSSQVDHDSESTGSIDEIPKDPLANGGLRAVASDKPSFHSSTSKALSGDGARTAQRRFETQIPSNTADALGQTSTDPLVKGHDEDTFYSRSGHTSPTLSSLPRIKIPKHSSNVQKGASHLPHDQVNSELFYSSGEGQPRGRISDTETSPKQEQTPEGVDTHIFRSPRITKMLRGEPQELKLDNLGSRAVNGAVVEQSMLVKKKVPGTSNVRGSMERKSATPTSISLTNAASPTPIDGNKNVEDTSETPLELDQLQTKTGDSNRSNSAPYELRESRVPSSRIGRLWNYGGLAAGMFGGAITESLRRVAGNGGGGSYMLSAGNMDRLVTKLSRMRGAALKLGQMISFQDSKMLPAPIQEVLQRVQDRADYMPASQRNEVLALNLGTDWRALFSEFEDKPLAAASIGQVHRATLKSNGARVAVKVQYPGVSDSIDSDLNNLAILLTASRLLPKGLFLDKTIANARTELAWECDYIREAECGRRFGELLADDKDTFLVPKVYSEASGKQVLTMEFMNGIGVTRVQTFTQEQKDWIGTQILRLCLREIIEFKYMQTDPNWTNFLFNAETNRLELLDFGASREYPDEFISRYSRLLAAASKSDRTKVTDLSVELGYLTGHESKTMLDAHLASVLTLAEPFLDASPEVYDFRDQTITERVKALIPVMIKERLAPPPEETYSLHRKLSGAFLLCARLGSRVRCRDLFQNSMTKAGLL